MVRGGEIRRNQFYFGVKQCMLIDMRSAGGLNGGADVFCWLVVVQVFLLMMAVLCGGDGGCDRCGGDGV